MSKILALMTVALLLLLPAATEAQNARATLEAVATAMGANTLKSIEYTGTGMFFFAGQSTVPGAPWPRFDLKNYTQAINYETASLRRDQVAVRVDARGGGVPVMGEARQIVVLSGDHAWAVMGETVSPQPRLRGEQQAQLWLSPHGVIKGALANNATVDGRTIAYTVPGRLRVKATVDDRNLIETAEAVFSNQVVGDMPVEVSYSDYRDFGGVKFPMKIRQTAGGFPAFELTVEAVRPNATVDIAVPEAVRQATNPYGKVTSQAAAEGAGI